MSDQHPPAAAPAPSGKPPIVPLPQWVNVVLVLILLASCGAARVGSGPSAGEIANQVSAQVQSPAGGAPSAQEVEDLCRLLGAVAAKQGVSPDAVMSKDVLTRCHEVALDPATP
jgi:hypothetical protein